jgi:hypothetical protein
MTFVDHPLISHALSILRDAGPPASIAGARSNLAEFVPVIADADISHGPLSASQVDPLSALSATR